MNDAVLGGKINQMIYLTLYGNRWDCSCPTWQTIGMYRKFLEPSYDEDRRLMQPVCATPDAMNQKALKDLQSRDYPCHQNVAMVIGISVGAAILVTAVVIVVVVVIVRKRRKERMSARRERIVRSRTEDHQLRVRTTDHVPEPEFNNAENSLREGSRPSQRYPPSVHQHQDEAELEPLRLAPGQQQHQQQQVGLNEEYRDLPLQPQVVDIVNEGVRNSSGREHVDVDDNSRMRGEMFVPMAPQLAESESGLQHANSESDLESEGGNDISADPADSGMDTEGEGSTIRDRSPAPMFLEEEEPPPPYRTYDENNQIDENMLESGPPPYSAHVPPYEAVSHDNEDIRAETRL